MVIDVILYGLINGYKFDVVTLLEYMVIILFISVFFYIGYQGINQLDEDIEFILMFIRFILQLFRFFIGIARIKENSNKRVKAKSFALDTDEDSATLDNSSKEGEEKAEKNQGMEMV